MQISEYSESYEIAVSPFGKPSIYALVDPDSKEIKYIGKSVQPTVRYYNHISDSFRKKSAVYIWINKLLELNKYPRLFILEECAEEKLEELEKHWIRKLNNEGVNLLNFGGRRHYVYTPEKLSEIAQRFGGEYLSAHDTANGIWKCYEHGDFKKLFSGVTKGQWCNTCTRIESRKTGRNKEQINQCRCALIQDIVQTMLT
ncbi:GIY-YIG nuclease family protein [Endozoicomonas numazuensis]|uniref:GIY-YIG domain-containing protein n=1 Tax=Endozoicomonas numazuensis TaxID=1137799 RepID=A0A081NGI7_9GAMM|nr:GIY-YIG nuclease family protein [Endozoicomonas numazuensis]KEQ11356.1 hypothetical protein GZ78_29060 [Endozoicomonas numazuensis]KEQ17560.1 hypothetical protein GZ78_17605 [Endozoicomonas numazuensis]